MMWQMSDLFTEVPLAEMIAEAERELHLRRSVYPRQVGRGKLTQTRADRQIAVMEAIGETLRNISRGGS